MRSTKSLKDHIFPRQGRWLRSAPLPDLRHRPAFAQAGQVRRLHRLLELSRVPAHDAALDAATGGNAAAAAGDGILGIDDETGLKVLLKSGRFGPYVQLGDGDEPKRSSLPKGWSPDSLTLEKAQQLLALPRAVGLHPETGKPISAGIGRYGPFILHDGTYANLPDVEEVFTRRPQPRSRPARAEGRGRRAVRSAARRRAAIKTFEHADGAISVRDGRYGPYVNQGKVNATLPKTAVPADVTLEQALELLAERAAKLPERARNPRPQGRRPRRRRQKRKPQPRNRPPRNLQPRNRQPRRPHRKKKAEITA